MITLILSRPKGFGHDPDARIYYVYFEGQGYMQMCSIHHNVWAGRKGSHVKVRNGFNTRHYHYNTLSEAVNHALKWAERIKTLNNR